MGMLKGVEAVLGLPKSSLQKPVYSRVQLWGAALPTNTPSVPCIFVPQGRASICGGWLLASSVESAALGGMALANHTIQEVVEFILRNLLSVYTMIFSHLKDMILDNFRGLESMGKEEVQAYRLTS